MTLESSPNVNLVAVEKEVETVKDEERRKENPMTRKYEAWQRYSLDTGLLQLLVQLSLYKP